MGHTHHLIKFRKNILITFIHNLVTFFECFQRLLATFLSSVKQKNIVKDHMCSNVFNHETWFIASIATMNSASAVDCARVSCFFEHHEKISKPSLKQYLELLFMSSPNPTYSVNHKAKIYHFKGLHDFLFELLNQPYIISCH